MLSEKGYRETSMDEIAARVGIAKGTVYLHFPGKDELIGAIFIGMMEKTLRAVNEVASQPTPIRTKLEAILRLHYGDFYRKRVRFFSSIYHDTDFRRLVETKQSRTREIWEQLIAIITRLVDEGKARGEIKPTIPTPLIVSVFFSLQSPHLYEQLGLAEQLSVDELVNYLSEIYFSGIALPE